MSASLTITEARASLPAVLDRVEAGEEIILTRHGKPVAVVIRPDQLSRRRRTPVFEKAEELTRLLNDAREQPLQTESTFDPPEGWAERRVAEMRRDRDDW